MPAALDHITLCIYNVEMTLGLYVVNKTMGTSLPHEH